MTERELRERFQTEFPMLQAWGQWVKATLERLIADGLKDDPTFSESGFYKVPLKARVKDEKSLVDKAFYRGKDYSLAKTPYDAIEDKVGLRIVTLLTSEINLIRPLIESYSDWKPRLDKDPEANRSDNVEKFTYESVHYIIELSKPVSVEGIDIPVGTKCELQIRTLLQHAHSELTHDRIYKAKIKASPRTLRYVSRSAALIETADDYFKVVDEQMSAALKEHDGLMEGLKMLFHKTLPETQNQFSDRLNDYVYSGLDELASRSGITLDKLQQFLLENSAILERIQDRLEWDLLSAQPVSVLVYYLVQNDEYHLKQAWNLPDQKLEHYFTDLGKNPE
jgi:putative GTP pyrophosphokinase